MLKRSSHLATATLAAMSLTACAGGGGGSPIGSIPTSSPSSTAGGGPGYTLDNPPVPSNPTPFTQFPINTGSAAVTLSGIGQWNSGSTISAGPTSLTLGPVNANAQGAWVQTPTDLVAIHPQDTVVHRAIGTGVSGNLPIVSLGAPLTSTDSIRYTTYVDAPSVGWSYQTFGWWYGEGAQPGSFTFGGYSVGSATPAGSIPTTGSATFTGFLGANIYSTSRLSLTEVAAPMSLAVDFGARSARFSSSDWGDGSIVSQGTALSGVLTYSAGQNALAGNLTSANGHYAGPTTAQFYGPSAQEVGGAFVLRPTDGSTTELVTGGFGAKR